MNGASARTEVGGSSHLDHDVFDALRASQDRGRYPAWLSETDVSPARDLLSVLRHVREAEPAKRREVYREVCFYYSQANDERQKTSLALDERIGHSEEEFAAGDFDPATVAERLLAAVLEYDVNVLTPLLAQVEHHIVRAFGASNVLLIGRDFTPVFVAMHARRAIDPRHLFLANVSRAVRDAALGGKLRELRALFDGMGLTKKALLARGLLLCDSSMKGKVPAAILQALTKGMTDKETYSFLRRVDVRYVKSARTRGLSVSERARSVASGKKALDKAGRKRALREIERIEEFPLKLGEMRAWRDRRHKLFEWRPKSLLMATDVTAEGRLVSARPERPGDLINSALGVAADQALYRRLAGAH